MRPGLTKAREFVSGERGQRAAGEITTSLQKLGGGSIAIGRDNVLEFVVGQIDLLNRTVARPSALRRANTGRNPINLEGRAIVIRSVKPSHRSYVAPRN